MCYADQVRRVRDESAVCNHVSQVAAAFFQALTRLARHVAVSCRQALRQLQHTALTFQDVLTHYLQVSSDAVMGAWRAAAARVTKRARRERERATTMMAGSQFSRKSPGWQSGSPIPLKTFKSRTDLSASSSGVWSVSRGGTMQSLASTVDRSFVSRSSSFIASTPRYVP